MSGFSTYNSQQSSCEQTEAEKDSVIFPTVVGGMELSLGPMTWPQSLGSFSLGPIPLKLALS